MPAFPTKGQPSLGSPIKGPELWNGSLPARAAQANAWSKRGPRVKSLLCVTPVANIRSKGPNCPWECSAVDYHAQRRHRVLQTLSGQGLEAMLVSNPVSITYLTGFSGESSF